MANKNGGRFAHLLPILRKYKGYLWFGAIVTVFANSLMLVTPYLTKLAFDAISAKKPASLIFKYAALMVILALAAGIFRFAMRRSIIWASRKAEYDLRNLLFTKLLSLDQTYYNNTRTGDLMAHATNDIEAVRMLIGPAIMNIFNTFVSLFVAIGFMITLSAKLTMMTVVPMVFLAIAVNRLGTLVHKRFLKIQAHFAYLTSLAQENLAGVRVIKAYRREQSEIDRFAAQSRKYVDLNLHMLRISGAFRPLIFMIAGFVMLVVLYMGGRDVAAKTITLGTLVAFFGYMGWLIWPMMALGWVISLYQRGTASLDRINKILNTESNITDPKGGDDSRIDVKGKIEFRNLTFAYPGTDESKPILEDINLTIEPGTRLGIIGPTGSGKTTLVSLIPRLYPTKPGQLFIDDIDITLWPLSALRHAVGFVPQETFLFSDTLAANINYSTDQSINEGVADAARLAAIHSDIEQFPDQYDTILGERGITLSGGQKQRTALARAIMKDPAVLILDDATSSVDTETEETIFANLEKVLPGRTSIIISHRVSSIQESDHIVYIDNGRIAEQGSHAELMALNGSYAALYRRQLMEEQLENM